MTMTMHMTVGMSAQTWAQAIMHMVKGFLHVGMHNPHHQEQVVLHNVSHENGCHNLRWKQNQTINM
jgi:hypothetical protein